MHDNDDHERFTRLLLESEPVMLRSILVVVPNRADAREIMQETLTSLQQQWCRETAETDAKLEFPGPGATCTNPLYQAEPLSIQASPEPIQVL